MKKHCFLVYFCLFGLVVACDKSDTSKLDSQEVNVSCNCGEPLLYIYGEGSTMDKAKEDAEKKCATENPDFNFDPNSCVEGILSILI